MEEDLKTSAKGQILSIRDLPTLPKVLEEVTKLVQDPNTSIEAIAKVISRDQVLSAKVLKMVNSPVYGFPGRIIAFLMWGVVAAFLQKRWQRLVRR